MKQLAKSITAINHILEDKEYKAWKLRQGNLEINNCQINNDDDEDSGDDDDSSGLLKSNKVLFHDFQLVCLESFIFFTGLYVFKALLFSNA